MLTGKSKDYGPRKAADLKHAPGDFDSVSGTEMHQKVLPVQKAAMLNDRLAADMLSSGHVYGRQFALFRPDHIYPAYVVKYQMNPTEARAHRVEVACTAKVARFTVKGEIVWQHEGPGIAFVVVDNTSLKVKGKRAFDPWSPDKGDHGAVRLCEFVTGEIGAEDVVLVAAWYVNGRVHFVIMFS